MEGSIGAALIPFSAGLLAQARGVRVLIAPLAALVGTMLVILGYRSGKVKASDETGLDPMKLGNENFEPTQKPN